MGKTKAHRGGHTGDTQAALKSGIKEPPLTPTELAGDLWWAAVGAELEIQRDYLDMQDVGEENGLSHCGYLVLRKGEVVRVLYRGSAKTDDAGWLYAEVQKSLPAANVGRRGWLPAAVAEPPLRSSAKATPPQQQQAVRSTTGSGGDASKTVTSRSPLEGRGGPVLAKQGAAMPQEQSAGYVASSSSSQPVAPVRPTQGRASAKAKVSASSGRRGEAFPALPTDAFPVLPGHSGKAPVWYEEEAEEEPAPPPPPARSKAPVQPRDVEGTIARHRAVASAAAAKADAKGKAKAKAAIQRGSLKAKTTEDTCPICVEKYSAQRRHSQTSCCGVDLCAVCAEKSLRSKRCYFCREDADEFPAMV